MPSLLRDYAFQFFYGPADDRLHDFYIPALARSVRYDRATGFFSSSALAVAAAGIAHLIQNGGRMRLLVGASLDDEDVAAIERGYHLAERIREKFLTLLADPEDLLLRSRLEALAWMVAEGTLEIRVVLPVGPDGLPVPGDRAAPYFHTKEGVFTDAAGNQVAFSGSVNESATGWQHNYEQLLVFTSWDDSQRYLAGVVRRFERLWEGTERDWIALPIPEAVRERLIAFRPEYPPTRDPLETAVPAGVADERAIYVVEQPRDDDQRARILAQFLRDAPHLPGAGRLGAATAAIEPWPHQLRVSDAIVARFPERFLLADEVGLGKTIEAGLAIRQLLLSGRVRRCLILTPRSVIRQWQEELYEKFLLDIPRYDGGRFITVFGDEREPSTPNPFDSEPVLLASSQLVKRRERQREVLAALPWDLVVVDEAHHARRRDFLAQRDRPNRLLELLRELRKRTQGMLLLTATPMQVHPVEVWDLLMLLGLGGRWGVDEQHFLRFFRELRKPVEEVDWDFVFDMVRDELESGGTEDPGLAEMAMSRVGPVNWDRVRALVRSAGRRAAIARLPVEAQAVAQEYARRHTPLRRLMFRNTRELLREYARRGLIRATIPKRDPQPVWIEMTPAERDLYDRIEEYIAEFYARYEQERRGLGFIMTVYRRRLTSSFAAIERSLQRRLEFLRGQAPDPGLTDDDLEVDELEQDISEELAQALARGYREEIRYVEDFLHDIRRLSGDSKLERLMAMLGEIFRRRETVVIFTQYTDTMDYLRERLREVYGHQIACYSGRGGEEWRDGAWTPTTKEEIKNAFRQGERIKILLCTEAASEGLNLQTCGVLINYDMPWNPMRVEQRIGRVDRIGQRYPDVWVRNFFYEDTIEARVYERLSDRIAWFTDVVGELQPILTGVARSIETLAMLPRAERERRLEEEMARLRAAIDQQQVELVSLDTHPADEQGTTAQGTPVELADLERVLTHSPSLRERFRPHPTIPHALLLAHGDGQVAVTFDRAVFDAHPDTVRLVSYGDRLLNELLAQIEPPARSDSAAGLLRCAEDDPVPLRAYYQPVGNQARRIDRIVDLERALDGGDLSWSTAARAAAEADFRQHLDALQERDSAIARQRREAERLSLEERARQVLLRAALVEIVRQRASDPVGDNAPWALSEETIRNLRHCGFPFAPLLRLVSVAGLSLSPTDPYYREIEGASPESLTRRLKQLEEEAKQIVRPLHALTQHTTPANVEAQPGSSRAAELLAPPNTEASSVPSQAAARASGV
ncbi:MAG: helicase-related protein [Sphaerobacter sp.]|nr:helicase-related protein [Sphaerobacter sp.]